MIRRLLWVVALTAVAQAQTIVPGPKMPLLPLSVTDNGWTNYVMIYNGAAGAANYALGLATSTDRGLTWAEYGNNPTLIHGLPGSWDNAWVAQPWLIHDGSQYVVYYTGFDNTYRRIGRATSADLTTWTKYASNPVLNLGTAGDFDDSGVNIPVVLYDTNATHAFQMWYTGWPDADFPHGTTIGYAYSDDGISWTKVGKVLDKGAIGTFEEDGLATGAVFKSGSTYYIYYGGFASTNYHSALATCTDPADAGTYTKQGEIAGYTTNLTMGGITYYSNYPRSFINQVSQYLAYLTLHHTNLSGAHNLEATGYAIVTNFTGFSAPPTGPLLTLGSGWSATSAENASVLPVLSVTNATMMARYPMDDGSGGYFIDTVRYNYGTLAGGTSWVTGHSGGGSDKAVSLNGSNGNGSFGEIPQTRFTTNFTIAFWMKPASTSQSNKYLLTRHSTVGADNSTNQTAVIYEFVNDQVEFYATAFTGTDPRTGSQLPVASTGWHHICYTYNGSTWAGYHNGTNVFSTSRTFSLSGVTLNGWFLTWTLSGGLAAFSGAVDDVRLYNTALSSSDVTAIYNQ